MILSHIFLQAINPELPRTVGKIEENPMYEPHLCTQAKILISWFIHKPTYLQKLLLFSIQHKIIEVVFSFY